MAEFIEIKIDVDKHLEETVATILENYDCEGIILSEELYENGNLITNSNYVKAYLYNSEENLLKIQEIQASLEDMYYHLKSLSPNTDLLKPSLVCSKVKDTDWESNWKQYWHAQKLGKRIVVCPTWEEYNKTDESEVIINLDPGAAFGTGAHATTRLCLNALEEVFEKKSTIGSVLDVGTGSGILGIAAAKLGAKSIFGIDIDPVAIEVAQENSVINCCNTVCKFDSISIKSINSPYELILVNILAKIILAMLEDIKRLSKPGSIAIFSGLIKEKQLEVEEKIVANGFKIIKKTYEEDWVMIMAEKL